MFGLADRHTGDGLGDRCIATSRNPALSRSANGAPDPDDCDGLHAAMSIIWGQIRVRKSGIGRWPLGEEFSNVGL